MANGYPVVPLGIVKVPLQIDNQIVYKEMLVADVEIPAVLGYDFTTKNKCVITWYSLYLLNNVPLYYEFWYLQIIHHFYFLSFEIKWVY
jgi:hypothetical protein